jgi:hypothetical protein
MGWKGALRSYQAAVRRDIRTQQRELREAARQAKEQSRQEAWALVEQMVAEYEVVIKLLTGVHRECGPRIDWDEVAQAKSPSPPNPINAKTEAAAAALAAYRPGFFARLFGGSTKVIAGLEAAIVVAKGHDELETQRQLAAHAAECREIEDAGVVAAGVLRGDISSYREALAEIDAFEGFDDSGSKVQIEVPGENLVTIDLIVPTKEDAIPEKEKGYTPSGNVSDKMMPKARAAQLYQDFVCGMALRVCREIFAALPVGWVVVTVRADVLDTKTGYTKPTPILSVIAPRRTVESFNYESVDASDAMTNFIHRMAFKKTAGLAPVVPLTIEDLPREPDRS